MADALDPGTWTWWQIVLVVAGALLLALAGTSAWALSKLAGDIDDELGQR